MWKRQKEPKYWDDPVQELPNRKFFKGSIYISLIAIFTFAIGSTLASNINVNTGGRIEFGQGLTSTAACSGSTPLTLKAVSNFVNERGAGSHFLNQISLSNIPVGCNGVDFIINAYDSTTGNALNLFPNSGKNAIVYDNSGTFVPGYGASGASVLSSSGSFTLTFSQPIALTSAIAKLTIQSLPHTLTVGDAGPGGGIIFYTSEAAFSSVGSTCSPNCHYLEAAPDGWSGSASDPAQSWSLNYSQGTGQQLTLTGSSQSGFPGESDNWFIGQGFPNSTLMANQSGHGTASENAALRAFSYAGSDSSSGQWFLPSANELNELCKFGNSMPTGDLTVQCAAGTARLNFAYGGYWSSSESNWSPPGVRAMGLLVGNLANVYKYDSGSSLYVTRNIRPIRAF